MSGTIIGPGQTEQAMLLSYEVSDEALETAAGTGSETAAIVTINYCTYFHFICPGSLTTYATRKSAFGRKAAAGSASGELVR
ncbi:MAG TPA: hypothetical protein VFJ59_17475 [Pseudolabrys sp.]|jgi:hypothetical protein|nr:hypothetical protein [Pseudolabrys sp.]